MSAGITSATRVAGITGATRVYLYLAYPSVCAQALAEKVLRLAWWIRVMRLIRGTPVPRINHEAQINHVNRGGSARRSRKIGLGRQTPRRVPTAATSDSCKAREHSETFALTGSSAKLASRDDGDVGGRDLAALVV